MGKFTPLDETKTKRLEFDDSEVKLLSGKRHTRTLGLQATVKIRGKIYQVFGSACSLPHCYCDAYIKEVKTYNKELIEDWKVKTNWILDSLKNIEDKTGDIIVNENGEGIEIFLSELIDDVEEMSKEMENY